MARRPNPPLIPAPATPPTTPPQPTASPTPSPSDHLRLLIELLRPATPELGRRWLAALLLVPEDQRQRVVEAVEARIVAEFGSRTLRSLAGVDREAHHDARTTAQGAFTAVGPDIQRPGYTERVETTYEPTPKPQSHAPKADATRRPQPRRSKPA